MSFQLKSNYQPAGDQPQAIAKLLQGLKNNNQHQVLLGVTGSGKTYTIANVIEKTQLPTLVISHNKTLAGQLYQEFRDFFPHNAVSYFVSYYDYYQPEAYMPTTDTYIEKEVDINQEIDKLRLLATTNLQTRQDNIIIASVSCIYNIGNPDEYANFVMTFEVGQNYPQNDFLLRLTQLQYERSDYELKRGTFRVKGDTIEIWPAYASDYLRLSFLGNILEKITWHEAISGKIIPTPSQFSFANIDKNLINKFILYPAKHYITNPSVQQSAFTAIRRDLKLRLDELIRNDKKIEAYRLEQKVSYDLDMISELGFVNGIENYSRYFDHRDPGDPPFTLIDHFRKYDKWLLVIDESHITIPQIRGMYNGDQARKQTLIDYGFRLPSALDNRPLKFTEFLSKITSTIYVSATPSDWELTLPHVNVVEQIVRPTGLIDPEIETRTSENQLEDLTKEIIKRQQLGQRVLVTTITKKLAEALTDYLNDHNNIDKLNVGTADLLSLPTYPKIAYLHSDIDTLDRQDILDDLRAGTYDVLIGINLLREGLDLPEVSLVAILDADKIGFLRSTSSLIQLMGRAARHLNGQVIMYADRQSLAMKEAIAEVNRRRQIQLKYNQDHHITPKSIQKEIRTKLIDRIIEEDKKPSNTVIKLTAKGQDINIDSLKPDDYDPEDKIKLIKRLRKIMHGFARALDFEQAARVRDKIRELEN